MDKNPPAKRQKLGAVDTNASITNQPHSPATRMGLSRPISPPLSRRKPPTEAPTYNAPTGLSGGISKEQMISPNQNPQPDQKIASLSNSSQHYFASPIQLTQIEDLAPHQNADTVALRDILGDPLIKECWNFNFLFDLDFVMKQFDADIRDLVQLKVIHGFWRKEDERRIALLEDAERYKNIELLHAYIPDPFGTHHSKMLILFRHDDTAQIIIHTANMIYRDWSNMTQAVWRSPLLPLSAPSSRSSLNYERPAAIGSGHRFKVDLLRYLKAYGNKLNRLTKQLDDYDFSEIRAAFIGSTPSRLRPAAAKPSECTSYGWLGLQEILSTVPISPNNPNESPRIVVQVSSIATLGATPTWLAKFQSALSRHAVTPATSLSSMHHSSDRSVSLRQTDGTGEVKSEERLGPKFSIIFPTPGEIRTSLDGYASGGSIHTKLQSAQQQKQLQYLHPLLCHWKYTSSSTKPETRMIQRKEAHRGPAAPHIKTYIRFSDESYKSIDWAMVTSANLSKQAWGDVVNKKDEIWIQSWEAGVVVWPALFAGKDDEAAEMRMVPCFGKDMPADDDNHNATVKSEIEAEVRLQQGKGKVVGLRMPYDVPLSPYTAEDKPWCATMRHEEPDWKGLVWGGH